MKAFRPRLELTAPAWLRPFILRAIPAGEKSGLSVEVRLASAGWRLRRGTVYCHESYWQGHGGTRGKAKGRNWGNPRISLSAYTPESLSKAGMLDPLRWAEGFIKTLLHEIAHVLDFRRKLKVRKDAASEGWDYSLPHDDRPQEIRAYTYTRRAMKRAAIQDLILELALEIDRKFKAA